MWVGEEGMCVCGRDGRGSGTRRRRECVGGTAEEVNRGGGRDGERKREGLSRSFVKVARSEGMEHKNNSKLMQTKEASY